jgi:hypothetical protein
VRIDDLVGAKVRMVEMVNTIMACGCSKSAKDRILKVDTPGQHVPPYV